VISSLVSGNTYYFGIRTKDNVPNTFDISNSPSAAANVPDPVGAGTYDDTSGSIAFVAGWQTQAAGSAYSSTIRFTNSPAVAAYFSFTGT